MNAVTGISWKTVPFPNSTAEEQYAEALNMCWRASDEMDSRANQVLRATVDTEVERGPDFRLTVGNSLPGEARLQISRWPVVSIVSGKYAAAGSSATDGSYLQWTTIPASQIVPEHPIIGLQGTASPSAAGAGPAALIIAPSVLDWSNGRNGFYLSVTYVNGWPHAGIDTAAASGATSVHVDDITGWTGMRGTILDGSLREVVNVTAVTPDTTGDIAGPGTLTLAAALRNTHTPPANGTIVITTMPEVLMEAAIYYATAMALVRGTTAVTVQAIRGSLQGSGGPNAAAAYIARADAIVARYARIV